MRSAPSRERGSGFTLLEILVVVFIVGIIAGFATLSLSGRALEDRMQEEAQRLHRLFRLAAEEALLTGLELGWRQGPEGYAFLALGPDGWFPYGDAGPLRARRLPAPMRLQLEVGDLPIPTDPERIAPQLLFLSSGELTPFDLRVTAPETAVQYQLIGQMTGEIRLQRAQE